MANTKLIGFDDPNEVDSDDGYNNNNVSSENKSKKKGAGAFGCMGLSKNVLKGIVSNGYKRPTPIQRKTIPLALEGRDVVAMARTGSGKTACFLIPMLEKLKMRQPKVGARALILSPTRELALQTLKFIKSLANFTDLRATVVLGGDCMDDQFESIHNNPDILVATPGRFLHLCIEMDLKLDNVEYVVYDEADQLFEMGWGEQINEIANRLPESRQTLLISATLPKVLVEFAKAGLSDPVLIRLDVESKLPEELKLSFITCRPEEKLAVLLCLLKYVIKPDSQTIVFASTMHHVEYIHMILDQANITNTFIYSNLDSSARKINAAKFKAGVAKVLIVTDVAARGIDIPHLDNVINFNFPAKSKLFVHRVGRCARAGRTGTAYNIVSSDEYAYLLDLNLFLGLPFNIVPPQSTKSIEGAIGKLPQSMIEQELAELITWHDNSTDLSNMQNVCKNAYQQYIRSRPAASTASIKRVKELDIASAGVHSEFVDMAPKIADLLTQMKSYRPRGTVFEICRKPTSTDYKVMTAKREFHKDLITKFKSKQVERKENTLKIVNNIKQVSKLDTSTNDEISDVFKEVVKSKKRKIDDLYKEPKKKKRGVRDEEFYIPYSAPDKHTEDGLAVNSFTTTAEREQMDLTGDNEDALRQQKQIKKWDRKKKKMVTVNNTSKVGKIRTESGAWISASFKTTRYKQWKEKSKIDSKNDDDYDDVEEPEHVKKLKINSHTHWGRHNKKLKEKLMRGENELKRPEQILKQRKIKELKKEKQRKQQARGKDRKRKREKAKRNAGKRK